MAQSKNARAIGILYLGAESDAAALTAALRRGLVERGYAEERDFRLEIRFANNDASQLRTLARSLVTHGVAVIVTNGTFNPNAVCTQTTCDTTADFVHTVYGPSASYTVNSFYFHYKTAQNGEWTNASPDLGGNSGDISGN